MKKQIILSIVTTATLALFVGCNDESDGDDSSSTPEQTTSVSPEVRKDAEAISGSEEGMHMGQTGPHAGESKAPQNSAAPKK